MPSSIASGKTRRNKETTSKGRAPSTSTGSGGKGRAKVAKGNSGKGWKRVLPQTHSSLFLPLLSVWVLALVALAGLIYWGVGSGHFFSKSGQNPPPPLSSTRQPKDSETRTQPSAKDPSASPAAQATPSPSPQGRPIFDPRENFTSRDIPNSEPHELPPRNRNNHLALNTPMDSGGVKAPIPPHPIPPATPPVARVAIVIDDFGQDLEMARRFLSVPLPLTFSVLPFQRHSKEIAELAHSRQHEVILHLPMQPRGYPKTKPGEGALLLSMSGNEIQKHLRSALDTSPHFKGMNNHMGSRFTESAKSMKVVLGELHHRGLYFLDSSTSPLTVGCSLAGQLQVPSRKRDIFLDHNPSEDFIRTQLRHLIRKAKIEGTALAIGHPHDATLRVLLEEAERFGQEGISIVSSGELMTSPHREARENR